MLNISWGRLSLILILSGMGLRRFELRPGGPEPPILDQTIL